MNDTLPFDGDTYDKPRDGTRLTSQYQRVFRLMRDGQWRTLTDIAMGAGGSVPAVSARLRDMRKPKFGGHTVERRYLHDGVWVYRLLVNDQPVTARPPRPRLDRDHIEAAVSEWWDHARYEGKSRLVEILCDELGVTR